MRTGAAAFFSSMDEAAVPCVAIVGGTHGNEMAGINLVRRMKAAPDSFQRRGITTLPILGNPAAVSRCTRFIDCDLNRCFSSKILSAPATAIPEGRDVW